MLVIQILLAQQESNRILAEKKRTRALKTKLKKIMPLFSQHEKLNK